MSPSTIEGELKSIFDKEPDEADAAIDAGQFVAHDRVVEWLKTWGTPNALACPTREIR